MRIAHVSRLFSKKIAVDSQCEPVYNTARSVPADVGWDKIL